MSCRAFQETYHIRLSDKFKKNEQWISFGRLVVLEGEQEALQKVKYNDIERRKLDSRPGNDPD
eukprot:491965-Alexandrium_andersonii.AAC.1